MSRHKSGPRSGSRVNHSGKGRPTPKRRDARAARNPSPAELRLYDVECALDWLLGRPDVFPELFERTQNAWAETFTYGPAVDLYAVRNGGSEKADVARWMASEVLCELWANANLDAWADELRNDPDTAGLDGYRTWLASEDGQREAEHGNEPPTLAEYQADQLDRYQEAAAGYDVAELVRALVLLRSREADELAQRQARRALRTDPSRPTP